MKNARTVLSAGGGVIKNQFYDEFEKKYFSVQIDYSVLANIRNNLKYRNTYSIISNIFPKNVTQMP